MFVGVLDWPVAADDNEWCLELLWLSVLHWVHVCAVAHLVELLDSEASVVLVYADDLSVFWELLVLLILIHKLGSVFLSEWHEEFSSFPTVGSFGPDPVVLLLFAWVPGHIDTPWVVYLIAEVGLVFLLGSLVSC